MCPHSYYPYDQLTCVSCSVCVITILRIAFAAQFDANDLTYDYIKISTTTVLEPTLGIMAASLPMFPPAFKNLLGGESEHDSLKVRSSSTTRLRSNGMDPSPGIPRLDDSYPLADLETDRTTESKATSSDGRANSCGIEYSTDSRGETHPYSKINVQKWWEVRSE